MLVRLIPAKGADGEIQRISARLLDCRASCTIKVLEYGLRLFFAKVCMQPALGQFLFDELQVLLVFNLFLNLFL